MQDRHGTNDFAMIAFYDVNQTIVYGDIGRAKRNDGITKFEALNFGIGS